MPVGDVRVVALPLLHPALQRAGVAGELRDVLRRIEIVAIRHLLHLRDPAFAVAIVDELLGNDALMLPGDDGHVALWRAVAVRTVTGSADGELPLATIHVGLQTKHFALLIACRWRILRAQRRYRCANQY